MVILVRNKGLTLGVGVGRLLEREQAHEKLLLVAHDDAVRDAGAVPAAGFVLFGLVWFGLVNPFWGRAST